MPTFASFIPAGQLCLSPIDLHLELLLQDTAIQPLTPPQRSFLAFSILYTKSPQRLLFFHHFLYLFLHHSTLHFLSLLEHQRGISTFHQLQQLQRHSLPIYTISLSYTMHHIYEINTHFLHFIQLKKSIIELYSLSNEVTCLMNYVFYIYTIYFFFPLDIYFLFLFSPISQARFH